MLTSTVQPSLPSGHQMDQDQVPVAVQQQIRGIALHVLQRLLTPILQRRRLRKARQALTTQYLKRATNPEELETAAAAALLHTSFLGAVLRDGSGSANPGQRFAPRRENGGSPEPVAAAAMGSDAGEGDAKSPAVEGNSPEPGAAPASEDGGSDAPFTPSTTALSPTADKRNTTQFQKKIRSTLGSVRPHMRVYLEGEVLECGLEQATEVLLLLGGAVERRGDAVALRRTMNAAQVSAGTHVRRGSTAAAAAGLTASRAGAAPLVNTLASSSRRGSASQQLSGTSSSMQSATKPFGPPDSVSGGGAGLDGTCADPGVEQLSAPQVVGELSCLGGFPYCASVVVTSPTAVVARLPLSVYGRLVQQVLPESGQRRLFVEAMQMRERLMPFYAPLSLARLQLCPLLTHLRGDHLEHVRDLAIPRVFAAGMDCGDAETPRHIFIIRRGVVQMTRSSIAEVGGTLTSANESELSSQTVARGVPSSRVNHSLEMPKNRPVLVEGHTYGETACISGDSMGERFSAVTHVDMYMLPFAVLIQLMKQAPEVQSVVYHGAQTLSLMRDKDWPGVPFGPALGSTELPCIHGIVAADGILAGMSAVQSDEGIAEAGGLFAGKRGESQARAGLSAARTTPPTTSGGTNRRVTIFEETSSAGSPGGLSGGRVSSALIAAMEQLPVVRLLPSVSAEFFKAARQQWQCVSYQKGDTIAVAGEECNRLLLFLEGRAGVVRNVRLFHADVRPGTFGAVDLSGVSTATLCPIPGGHVVGYTCVRRHRWARSIVAMEDDVEVWEMRRAAFVQLLREHGMEREMLTATLQLLQPLAIQKDRLPVLDYQPLMHPMPNSLWRHHRVPNLHPVLATDTPVVNFPAWREGDFPLDRHTSLAEAAAHAGTTAGGVGGGGAGLSARRTSLTAVSSVRGAAFEVERQRSAGPERGGESPVPRCRRPSSGGTGRTSVEAESLPRESLTTQLSGLA